LFADGKRMQFVAEQDARNSAQESGILTLKAESAFQKLDNVLQEIIERSSGRKKNLWQKIIPTRSMNLLQPLAPFLQQLSTDPYLQQSLLTLSALTGTPIPDLQVRDLFLPALIRKSGLFFPIQGWDAIINRLQDYLVEAGVKFFLQTKVLDIFPPQKNIVGIRLADQSQQWADEILNTTNSLVPEEMRFSTTQPMIIFHLGLKNGSGLETFSYHNIIMINGNLKTWNSNKNFSPAWLPDYLYVYHSTSENPKHVPEGRGLISLKIPLPSTPIQMREKEMLRLNVLNLLERSYLPGLKQNIEMESTEIIDPVNSHHKINPNNPAPFLTPGTSRVIHLHQYYGNRRPSIPAMLFAVQRWIESTRS
jgi:phytoene dehydrogenase-like protein